MSVHPSSPPQTSPNDWSPFLWVAAALVAGTMGTALASPLYPLYQQAWGFPASTITEIFVSYMFGVMAALLFLGRLPDHYGELRVLRAGLALIALGLALSAAAPGVGWLLAGRVVIGLASGLITTSAMAALVDLEPTGNRARAMRIASTTSVIGFGLGPLVAGVIAQFLPAPLVTAYLVVLALVAVVLVALNRLHAGPRRGGRLSLRPAFVLPGAAARPAFAVAAAAAFLVFALFSLFAALAPSFLNEMLPWQGTAISGASIAAVLFVSGATQLVLRGVTVRRGLSVGLGVLTAAVGLLAVALAVHSALLFAASDVLVGVGHGIAFMSAMAIVNQVSAGAERAGIFASFLSIGYIGTIVPVLGVGLLADRIGVLGAVIGFCALFGVAALVLLQRSRRVLAAG